ncbi:MAG TPA: hypothetical protein VIT88_08015 [Pyrinomonadaceae bacterium]
MKHFPYVISHFPVVIGGSRIQLGSARAKAVVAGRQKQNWERSDLVA